MAKNSKEKQKEYDSKRAGQRTRNWTLIFYPEDLPDDWKERVDELCVKWIESPLHDRDENPDGTPKKAHIHTLFMFETVKNSEQVKNLFGGLFGLYESGSIVGIATPQQVTDRSGIVRYMAHLDHPSKAQYDVNDIVGHNGADVAEIMRYSVTETLNKMIAIEEFIEQNKITEYATLCRLIRYNNPDWYQIVVTKNTVHFRTFVNSFRNSFYQNRIDPKTGEVIPE